MSERLSSASSAEVGEHASKTFVDAKIENEESEEADLYIDEEMFAILRERREEALKGLSDYNPFVNHTKSSVYEKIKLVVGGCTLLPLRCLGLGPLLLGLYGLTSLSIIGLSEEQLKEKPLSSWRKGILSPTVKYGSRVLLFLLGYQWVKTKGEASDEAPIVISNHPSWFEHLWILHVYVPSVVGKEDVKKVPLYGTYARAIQTIFVKRSSPESRKEAAEEIYDRVASRYEKLKTRRKGREAKQQARDDLRLSKQNDKTKKTKAKNEKKANKNKNKKKQLDTSELDLQQSNGLIGTEEDVESPRVNETEQQVSTSEEAGDGSPAENGHAGAEAGPGSDGSKKKMKKGKKEKMEKKEKRKRDKDAARDEKSVWPPLFLFPEGGNSSASGFISFKLGAFNPGVPIQPVVVRLPFKHHDVSPTPGTNKFSLLVRTLCQFHNKMEITYLPVYYPSEEEQNDPKIYAHNVRQAMADELNAYGIEATEHSYEDVMLLHHALRRKYPLQKVLLEARKLLDRFEILELKKDTLTRCLDKFIAMDKDRSGEVSFKEFCSVLHLPDAEITSRLFAFLDTNDDGVIDFREYITGMATLAKVIKPRALTDIFALFADGEDHFTLDKARETLKELFACLTEEQIEGILSRVGDLSTPGAMTYDEFATWAKYNPEYIHFLLTTDRMSAKRRGSVVDDVKGKGKQAEEREIAIDSGEGSSSPSEDEVDRSGGEGTNSASSKGTSREDDSNEGDTQQLQKLSSKTKRKENKKEKQKKTKNKRKNKAQHS